MGTIQTIKLQASLIGLISTIKSDLGFGVIKKMRTISWPEKKMKKEKLAENMKNWRRKKTWKTENYDRIIILWLNVEMMREQVKV